MTTYRKKLIEVALPLEEINVAAAREKSIRHGHPSTLHLWWARRPLASCRAVLFASIVDDPDQEGVPQPLLDRIDRLPIPHQYKPEWEGLSEGERRRKKLFGFIAQLVQWENSNDPDTLQTAHELIHAATGGNPPPFLDPFAGGGSIPLEAQRLGLEAHGSDLNPVAVLINKAMIEIPPKFAGQPPVNPSARSAGGKDLQTWRGAQGLAEDVRYYGKWMRDEAEKRIGHLYPKAKLPKEYGGGEATVIAWIWARTVASPNPAARGAHVPLVRSFALSTKKGKEAWVEPVTDTQTMTYRFEIRTAQTHPSGEPRAGTIGKKGGLCLLTGAPMDTKYVREQAQAGRMGARLMAVVAEGGRGRIYLPATEEHELAAVQARPAWTPDQELAYDPRNIWCVNYGLTRFGDLFTVRQLATLSALSELVGEAREKVKRDASAVGRQGALRYTDAIITYLAFGLDKALDRNTSLCTWESKMDRMKTMFARQAIAMAWDYVETNPFGGAGGDIYGTTVSLCEVLDKLLPEKPGRVSQQDAVQHGEDSLRYLITTDPPYYDNISYAALSDFFYVWLRRTLSPVYPDLFGTMATPKETELIADPYRHGGKDAARKHFESGMRRVFRRICETAHREYPVTVIYAFKQSETEYSATADDSADPAVTASTGWETFLTALTEEGFQVSGTWPMRTELATKITARTNILASSIALVCRPRLDTATTITRPEFQRVLKRELPTALRNLQSGNIAPVDLAQSAIGPGMAVFSRYKAVLEASGKPMTVRTALQIINQVLDETLAEQEGWYDEPTRWATRWFAQHGFAEGLYGTAETLATATAVAVSGLAQDGIVRSGGGKVKLLSRDELPADYDPTRDERVTVWEVTQHLARALDQKGIEAAGRLMARFRNAHPDREVERARDLAYRLFALCEAKRWAQEARPYNALVASWTDIEAASQEPGAADLVIEGGLFGESA